MRKLSVIIACLLTVSSFGTVFGQTCCSGGVPLSGNIGLPQASQGVLQFSLRYDANLINALISEDKILDDRSRSRGTHSLLLESSYHFSRRWSVNVMFSYVVLTRRILSDQQNSVDRVHGPGDAVLLLRHQLIDLPDKAGVGIGAGLRLPTGPSSLRNDNDIRYSADLQPGSGATDMVFWSNGFIVPNFYPSATVSLTGIYRATGKNRNYLNGSTYEFGNEGQVIFTVSNRMTAGMRLLDSSLGVRWRMAGIDRIQQDGIPNTGGSWIYLRPGISYLFSPEWSLAILGEIPLYRDLNGTQLTTSGRVNIGLYHRIDLKNNPENLIEL